MNPSQSELLAAVERVVAAFDALGIDYLIGGSVASSVFGEPRQTVDADLLACVVGRNAAALVDLLSAEFYADLGAILSAVQQQGSFNVIHLETMTKVDVFVSWRTPFGQAQLVRRKRIALGELAPRELYFASAEDTVLAKLDWYKKGGSVSDRQWRDILGVLKVQGDRLDKAYLSHWARELGVEELLLKAFQAAN